MDSEALRLSELVCARVCHDLGGLAGMLAGTLQLAHEDGDREAVALARDAADALARRLRLLRAALGPVAEPLGAPGIADLSAGLGERLRVDASGLGSEPLGAEQARLALALLLLGAEALPVGGTLRLTTDGQGALLVTADGPRAAWPPGTTQNLATGALPNAPRGLLAPLCHLLARTAAMELAAGEAPPLLRAMPLNPSRA
jgi:histidine phosphotransferase ChpT